MLMTGAIAWFRAASSETAGWVRGPRDPSPFTFDVPKKEVAWRQSERSLELPSEMALIGEDELRSDRGRALSSAQSAARIEQANLHTIGTRRYAGQPAEMT